MLGEHIKKAKREYFDLWNELSGWKLFLFYILHYTLLFMLLWEIVFSYYSEAGKTLMWVPDGTTSYFPQLVYLSKTIREGIQAFLAGEGWKIPLYDFTLGPAKLCWESDPVALAAVFWPWDKIDILYDILVIVRFYLVGLSFSVFGFYFKQSPIAILIGAVNYTFCGFMLYAGIRDNPFFVSAVIYLPLLIIGIEEVMKDRRPFFLIVMVFLTMTSSLYMACMLAIIISLYILVRILEFYKPGHLLESVQLAGWLIASAGIGIALSGGTSIPVLVMMLKTNRLGHDITSYTNFLHYGKEYYERFFSDFIIVPDQFLADTYLGFSILALPAVILLFVNRKKEERSLRILFLLLTGLMLSPAAAYVLSAFNAIKNRWCFSYAFCVSAILMFKLPDLIKSDKRTRMLTCISAAVYFITCYFIIDHQYYHGGIIILLIITMIFIFGMRMPKSIEKQWKSTVCVIITCVSIFHSAFLLYDITQGNYISQFREKEESYGNYSKSQYASFSQSSSFRQDNSFFRVAGNIENNAIGQQALKMAFYDGINGLTYYTSYAYSGYGEWIRDLELAREDSMHRYFGLRTRSPMLTLAGVKYFVLRNTGGAIVPYGFREIERIENSGKVDSILVNDYALPIGYTYEAYIDREEYNMLPVLGKQEAQLQAVVLSEKPYSADITNFFTISLADEVPAIVTDVKGLSWQEGILKVTEEKATITLEFEGLPNTEIYLRVVGLDLTNGGSARKWDLIASTNKTLTDACFSAEGYLYDHGMKTQLLDLGYTEDGYTTCTITFPQKGTFKLQDLEIWCQPMDHYADQIKALRAEPLENVEINWRGVTGTISISRDKFLCFSIPYDEGWTVYVDGKKADLIQANIGFMGVELEAGSHEIELKYWPPGLTCGIILSSIGLIGLIFLIVWQRKRIKRTKTKNVAV